MVFESDVTSVDLAEKGLTLKTHGVENYMTYNKLVMATGSRVSELSDHSMTSR
jgi:NADH dehydrogenase FAD-containing subunit